MKTFFGLVNVRLTLTKEQKKELAAIEAIIEDVLKKRTDYLRGVARAQGLTAATLAELKSESGLPFVEERQSGGVKIAVVKETTIAGSIVIEAAYLCRSFYERQKDTDTCGWVKGQPREQSYNSIGPLSGSAGTLFFCHLCGKQIGEEVTMRSLR